MEFLAQLWLPILLAAVFVFIASSIFHVALPIHRRDYGPLPGEDPIMDAMRGQSLAPGHYRFPFAESMKDLAAPEMLEKYKRGPVGLMTVMPNGLPAMGKSLVLWFAFSLVVGLFAAYLGWHAAGGAAATGAAAFRFTGTVAILGYALTHVVDSIWKGMSWSVTAKFICEGVIYGLITAGTFALLWPDAG